jgi:hypothetical protein
MRSLFLPSPQLWTCSHSILPRACLSASHVAMLFRLLLFLATSESTTLTMRVMLLQILQHPLNHEMQLICSLNISVSDTSCSTQLLQKFQPCLQQTRQFQSLHFIAATSAPAAVMYCAHKEQKLRSLWESTSTYTALYHGSEAGKQR